MSKRPKTYGDFKKEEERAEAIAAFRDKTIKGIKNIFSLKSRKQKATKLGLAGAFLALAVPYSVQEMTEKELYFMRVVEKEVITETSTTTVEELFQLEEMRDQFRDGELSGRERHVVDESKEISRDHDEDKRYVLELDNGKRYTVEPNLLQGFSQGDMDELWEDVKTGGYYNFTASKTVTGENVITGFKNRTTSYNYYSP